MIYTADMISKINNGFTPTLNTRIARYMGFENFKLMIDNKSLWFSNSNTFMDENEGEIPLSFFEHWERNTADNYKSLVKLKQKVIQAFISCWFEYECELEQMWLSYGCERINDMRNTKGVCILSDVAKLAAYSHYLDTKVFRVKYIDYQNSEIIEPPFFFSGNDTVINERVFFVYKQKEYYPEKEIRAITYKKCTDKGLQAKINPMDFIEAIIINPHANGRDTAEIKEYIDSNGLSSKIIASKIVSRY